MRMARMVGDGFSFPSFGRVGEPELRVMHQVGRVVCRFVLAAGSAVDGLARDCCLRNSGSVGCSCHTPVDVARWWFLRSELVMGESRLSVGGSRLAAARVGGQSRWFSC